MKGLQKSLGRKVEEFGMIIAHNPSELYFICIPTPTDLYMFQLSIEGEAASMTFCIEQKTLKSDVSRISCHQLVYSVTKI